MPDDAERLIVFLEAKVNNFEKEMQRASGTATQSYGRMRDTSQRTTRQMEADMVRSTSRINQALASTSTQIGAMAKTFAGAFAGGIFAGGLAEFGRAARQIVKDTAAIREEAARAGVTTKVFQEWGVVAERSRIPIDALVDAFKELNIRADEFAVTGKGSAAEAFQRLGMTPQEVQQKLKDPSNLLLELMQRTRALKDTAAGVRIFDELLGGTGAEQMIRLLQQSDGEIRNIIQSANETGRVIDDQMIAKADDLDRRWTAMWSNFQTQAQVAIIGGVSLLDQFGASIDGVAAKMAEAGNSDFFKYLVGKLDAAGMIDNTVTMMPGSGLGGGPKNNVANLEREAKIIEDQVANLKALGFDAAEAQKALAGKRAEIEAEVQAIISGSGKGTLGEMADSVVHLEQVTVQATDLVSDYLSEYRQELALSSRERKIATEAQSILNDASGKGVQLSEDLARALATEKVARDEAEASSKRMTTQRDKETDAAKRQKQSILDLQSDLQFENQQLGRSPIEQRVYSELRSVGVDINSDLGKQIAFQVRINEQIKERQGLIEGTRNGFEEVGNTIRDSMGGALSDVFSGGIESAEDFFDRVVSGFAGIGQQFTQKGIDRLLGNVGMGGSSSGRYQAQPQGLDFRALTGALEGTSRSALDVARQFEGLNERADSKVLDRFLQASGTWKGMSSQDFAWCASFANAAIVKSGGQGTGSNMASSFLGWGQSTNSPKVGDIVVLRPQTRGASGHVGFVAGFGDGSVQVFGGNQGNGANVRSFGMDQVAGFRTAGDTQRVLAQGVEQGVMGANSKLKVDPWNVGGVDMRQASGGMGGMMGGGAMQMLGMGAGSFFQGMESGSPLGGGLSGIMAGVGAGLGPLGIAAGAPAGEVGSLFKRKESA